MKPTLQSLRKDQQVWATIEESIEGNELIINFNGDLVRVQNQTHRNFRVGQESFAKSENRSPLKTQSCFTFAI